MKQLPKKRIKIVVSLAVLVVASFTLGQVTPQIVPPSWSIGYNKLDFNDLNSTYQLLESQFDGHINQNAIMDGARAGLVAAAGDPYTEYLTAAEAKSLNSQLSGSLSGIGAEVDIRNNQVTIIAPVAGTPAAKAGLQPGDIIAAVNGVDTSSMTLDEAVAAIRGKAGTKVTLTIERGSNSPQQFTITRANITVPSVTWSMKAEMGGANDIGYINISEYGTDTSSLIVTAAQDLKNQGAKKVILDLRDNPGGYLNAAQAVVSQFTPQGDVVVDERHDGVSQGKLYSSGGGLLVGLPVVVLINGGSASASEITAGALRDDIGATLVGQKSFGKGSVQQIDNLPGGAELKVTIAHWFTPSGQGIDHIGITPKVVVPMTQANINAGQDPQLAKAIQLLSQ
ncbi:MAG TPA: S41 family peptidase [Candidatus Saccharimonadales bacterium]|nr:S41 family peptidase [Candidatus Saccharimonadales bacterium]